MYCDDDVPVAELTEILDALLALDVWPASYDGGPGTVAALKNLTSELIGRFCVAAQQATQPPPEPATPGPLTHPLRMARTSSCRASSGWSARC
jgi:hypothetical protein